MQRGRHAVRITYEQFTELTKQSECHYCGAAVVWSEHRKRGETTATNLDRKDNDRPYELGNVVVCCLRCNKAKNTHFTYDEWRELGRVIRGWRQAASEIPESRTGTSAPFSNNEQPIIPNGNTP